jgi:hypothetical protein
VDGVAFAGVNELCGAGTEVTEGGSGPGGGGAVTVVVGVPASRGSVVVEPLVIVRPGVTGSVMLVVPVTGRTGFGVEPVPRSSELPPAGVTPDVAGNAWPTAGRVCPVVTGIVEPEGVAVGLPALNPWAVGWLFQPFAWFSGLVEAVD